MMNEAREIMKVLEDAGFEARIAGGAVRDFVSGKEPKDIDIATTARPEQVVELFDHTIPTGLQHGTVTVVINHIPFEVTTLRIDTATDGRHATVEFHDDWELDAARRDFTFNAMFMDKSGKIFDFFNGVDDLKASRVQFVGDARKRIEEDYLRIMRYFRFLSRMPTINYDCKTLNVIADMASGLNGISGERIWVELKKILDQKNSFTTVRLMASILNKELSLPEDFRYMFYKDFNNEHPVLIKLVELYNRDEEVMKIMKNRFKASSDEMEFVRTFFMLNHSRTTAYDVFKHAENNFESVSAIVQTGKARNADIFKNWFARNGKPEWPVSGSDLLNEGFEPGKALGEELAKRRKEWANAQISA